MEPRLGTFKRFFRSITFRRYIPSTIAGFKFNFNNRWIENQTEYVSLNFDGDNYVVRVCRYNGPRISEIGSSFARKTEN